MLYEENHDKVKQKCLQSIEKFQKDTVKKQKHGR
jgi:hypothetical protein